MNILAIYQTELWVITLLVFLILVALSFFVHWRSRPLVSQRPTDQSSSARDKTKRPLGMASGAFVVWFAVVFVIEGFTVGGTNPERDRSAAFLHAIISGLENYRNTFGEYPQPKPRGKTPQMGSASYNVDGALMLYQALTGDGSDAIANVKEQHPSNGRLDDSELPNVVLKEIPRYFWKSTNEGYILVDGFGFPFQYSIGGVDTVNESYDVWSFAGAAPSAPTKANKTGEASRKWFKNW